MNPHLRLSATLSFAVVAMDVRTQLDARTGEQRSVHFIMRCTDDYAFTHDGRPLSSIQGQFKLTSVTGTSEEELRTQVGYFEGFSRFPEAYWATAPMSPETLDRLVRDCAFGLPEEVQLTVHDLESMPTDGELEAWKWPGSDQNTCDITYVRVMTHIGGPRWEELLLPESAES